ncbi:MAG: adenylate/guanylate cyclase domain-containing response regulator [Lentisphaeria bacterium]|nr:adenylate/guanylate cyclase domain-containing response regulator [Lentisphaeria bacterium]
MDKTGWMILWGVVICLSMVLLALAFYFYRYRRATELRVASFKSGLWARHRKFVHRVMPIIYDYDRNKIEADSAKVRYDAQQNELNAKQFKLAEASIKLMELNEQISETKDILAAKNLDLLAVKEQLEEEKNRSAALLRNILPERIIQELDQTGSSKPEVFEDVAVFFSDIINFTAKSSLMPPQVVIAELNDIFGEFDHICKRHNCERIKTIGDAYMCVSGMTNYDGKICLNIIEAAQEMIAYLRQRNETHEYQWEIRVGIHCGPIVAGVIGVEKYIYDIFGDTVNTASRMENFSMPMRINVSEEVYKKSSAAVCFEPRGAFEVKGKGQCNMFFVN